MRGRVCTEVREYEGMMCNKVFGDLVNEGGEKLVHENLVIAQGIEVN